MTLEKVTIVSKKNGAKTASQGPRDVLADDAVELFCVIRARVDGQTVHFTTAGKVKGIAKNTIRVWDEETRGSIGIEWFKVEPRMMHEELESNDPEAPWYTHYANAHVPGTPSAPKWIGHDTIEYEENPAGFGWSLAADAHPTAKKYDVNDGLGVMRYKVRVTRGEQSLSSPGMESTKTYGITKKVFRITFRQSDSFTGWLTSFFNVPGIYGSTVVQAQSHIGVDCSDLLTAAWNLATGKDMDFTSAGGMLKHVDVIRSFRWFYGGSSFHETDDGSGEPETIAYGKGGVKEGDVIFFCYTPISGKNRCKRWHHVGALYADSGPDGEPDGILDGKDIVLHAGPREPHLSTLKSTASAHVDDPTGIIIGRIAK
jgi:hypothetical protein